MFDCHVYGHNDDSKCPSVVNRVDGVETWECGINKTTLCLFNWLPTKASVKDKGSRINET